MKLVVIFDGSLFQAQMVKNLLENDGIESSLKDEIVGARSPVWRPGGGVKVMVNDSDYSRAKLIVDEYERNINSK